MAVQKSVVKVQYLHRDDGSHLDDRDIKPMIPMCNDFSGRWHGICSILWQRESFPMTAQGGMTMKAKRMIVTAVLVASALAFGGEALARGGGAGAGSGSGRGQGVQTMTQTRTQAHTQARAQVRPEGSQRRDGSFLSTGTTANGSTSRPANGRGVMDGTGINAPAPIAPATTP